MSEFFLSVVNMSISASWIVLAVLLMRSVLKKAPKWLTALLWAIVAVRLICPISIESDASLIPNAQTVAPSIMTDRTPQIQTGFPSFNNAINPIIANSFSPEPMASANPLQILIPLAAIIWGIGVFAFLVYGSVSYWRVKRKVSTAVLLRDNIYQSENVLSPFVLGLFKPKIYLPFYIDHQDMLHVFAHEDAHIRRRDHWWKPIGFTILTIHWFNPLLWLAYVLLCRDIELACDEKVIKDLCAEQRADYSQALLNCSIGRRMIVACPLAFGEVSVKNRVKSVLNYKKPAFWLLSVGVVAIVVLAVCFLTNPTSAKMDHIEFLSLTPRIENTACVWLSDGASYHSAGKIDKNILQELTELSISKKEISMNRSEDRDKTHTIVLQTEEDAQPTLSSYIEGLRIHFNSDFTSVWANNGVKPTLSYQVTQPQTAKELYDNIAAYVTKTPTIDTPSLRERFPMYFDLGTFKGLEIYVWQMSESSYSCGLLPGLNRNYTPEEIWNLHKAPASLEEMRAIIDSYIASGEISKTDVTLVPVTMPHSSYAYTIDDAYRRELNELFWSESEPAKTIEGNFRTYYQMEDGSWKYNGYTYKYRLKITGRMPNAVADTTYVYLSNIENISFHRAMWASGISSRLEDYFSPEDAVLVELWTHEAETPTDYSLD